MQAYVDRDDAPDLPDNPCPEIVDILMEAGPAMTGGMGPAPLPSSEIQAWLRGAGMRLTPWEFRLLRRLSREYVGEYSAASDPGRPAPWSERPSAERRRKVARHIRDVLRG